MSKVVGNVLCRPATWDDIEDILQVSKEADHDPIDRGDLLSRCFADVGTVGLVAEWYGVLKGFAFLEIDDQAVEITGLSVTPEDCDLYAVAVRLIEATKYHLRGGRRHVIAYVRGSNTFCSDIYRACGFRVTRYDRVRDFFTLHFSREEP